MHHAILLACDPGERLRPLTDEKTPTSLLALGSRRTLLQRSMERLETLIPSENLWIIAGPRQHETISEATDKPIHVVESTTVSPLDALREVLSEILGVPRSDDTSPLILQSATHVFSPSSGYVEQLAIAIHQVTDDQDPVAIAVRHADGTQSPTGIQVWPVRLLQERLASADFPDSLSVKRMLSNLEKDLPTTAFHDDGWVHVSDWPDVQRLLAYVEKPWGYERLWALNRHYAGKILFIRAGESLSLQYHHTKDETIRVSSGRMRFRAGPTAETLEEITLEPGMTYAIPPGVVHQMEALADCTVIEVSTPHLTDVVRLEDRYGRS